MASTEAETVTLSIDELVAMSDAELGQVMTQNRRPGGGYDLPVDGWDKLSKDDRARLAERLKGQSRGLAQSPPACSPPLDLDDLDARLRQVPANNSFSLRPEPPADDRLSPTPPLDMMEWETADYHKLIENGGRPLYPIHLIQDIFRDPDNYAELLRPWQVNISPVSPIGIFDKQLDRWKQFRKWQNDNRAREDDEGGFPAYVERVKNEIKLHVIPKWVSEHLAPIEADPSCLKPGWDREQSQRREQRRLCRERGCHGFQDYAEAVKCRLARHRFTHPFELDEDPKKQCKLTTWIEYLNYEYWWLDTYARQIERLQPGLDKAWQELVDTGILRRDETKEFVRTPQWAMRAQDEDDQAREDWQRAKAEGKRLYTLTQEHPDRLLRMPKEKRMSIMKTTLDKIHAAKRFFGQTRDRNNRVQAFGKGAFGHARATRNNARHRVLVKWVLDQVPLIEAEMNPSKENRPGSDGRGRTKRGLAGNEESLERQPLKKVRLDLPSPRVVSEKAPAKGIETQAEPGMVMD
ncbi:hypothetical protein GGS24DRAFT_485117 [Hypoxylon argillaceum]|nr:hypothetical protein GGS24DRAFT_485117 [Hypoxylon argillaceum]